MPVTSIHVTKRDGRKVLFNADKIHEKLEWAAEGFDDVSISEVELRATAQYYDGISTHDIDEAMIKSAADLISAEKSNMQYFAARLRMNTIRKEALGQYEPIPVYDLVKRNVELGLYDSILLDAYSDAEFTQFDSIINHKRDDLFTYAAVEQMRDKYLVQDRTTKQIFETPQYLYLLVAATVFIDYDKKINLQTGKEYGKKYRMNLIKEAYDAFSKFELSLPTPILAGVRTTLRQYSSCVLVETDDTLDSIGATSNVIMKYASQRAGLGIGAGSLRAVGDKVRGGQASHTGVLPFYQHFQYSLKSCCLHPDMYVEILDEDNIK